MDKCRMRVIVEVFYDDKWDQRESRNTGIERLDRDKIHQVYLFYRDLAQNKVDAIQWTADLLGIDRSTVYRAIKGG